MPKTDPVGCYFRLSKNEPSVGSTMEMEIHIPAELVGHAMGTLLCTGKVVGVRQTEDESHTGVTCTIEHYQLLPEAADVKTDRKSTK